MRRRNRKVYISTLIISLYIIFQHTLCLGGFLLKKLLILQGPNSNKIESISFENATPQLLRLQQRAAIPIMTSIDINVDQVAAFSLSCPCCYSFQEGVPWVEEGDLLVVLDP